MLISASSPANFAEAHFLKLHVAYGFHGSLHFELDAMPAGSGAIESHPDLRGGASDAQARPIAESGHVERELALDMLRALILKPKCRAPIHRARRALSKSPLLQPSPVTRGLQEKKPYA